MKNLLIVTTYCIVLFSCVDNVDCKKYIDEDYYKENKFQKIESESIDILGCGLIISYNTALNVFGEEYEIKEDTLISGRITNYHFIYYDNLICYTRYNDESYLKLSYVQLLNDMLIINFDGLKLKSSTKLDLLKKMYVESYCNCIYFEQINKYDLYFRGNIDDELISLIFINNKLADLEVRWSTENTNDSIISEGNSFFEMTIPQAN